MKKAVDNQMGGGYSGRVLANSKARIESRNVPRRTAPKSQSAFFMPCDTFGGAYAEAVKPAGFLGAGLSTHTCRLFLFESEEGGSSNPLSKEISHV